MTGFTQLFEAAFRLLNKGEFALALEKLNEAEKYHSEQETITTEDIYIMKGNLGLTMNDLELARDSFEKALQFNSSSAEACMGLAQVFAFIDMKNEAKTMCEWAVKLEPENDKARDMLARVNNLLGLAPDHINPEVEEEEEIFDVNYAYEEAFELYMQNKLSDALSKVEILQAQFEKDIFSLKGNIYLSMNKLDKAKEAFETVLKIDKKSSPACNGIAEVFYKRGMINDCKSWYEVALQNNPSDQFALLGLAKINQELGLSPIHSIIHFFNNSELSDEFNKEINRAYKYFENNEFDKSVDLIDKLIKDVEGTDESFKNEILSSLLNFKGFNYMSCHEYEEAKSFFEKSIELNPNSSQACAGLGEYLFLQGNDKGAKTMFEWAVKNNRHNKFAIAGLAKVNVALGLSPDNIMMDLGVDEENSERFNNLITLSYELFGAKKYNEALNALDEAESYLDKDSTKLQTKNAISSILNLKGFCNLSLNEVAKAKKLFDTSLTFNPNSSQACAGLGEICYLKEDEKKAKEMFELAIRNEPNNQVAVAGLAKVNLLLGFPEHHNSLIPTNAQDISQEISREIEDAYELFKVRRYDESIKMLKETENKIEKNYKEDECLFALGSINNFLGFNYLALNENENAQEVFEKALTKNPSSSQASAGLAEIFFLQGQDDKAKQMYEWAVKHNPENRFAVNGLIKTNRALGLPEDHNTLA